MCGGHERGQDSAGWEGGGEGEGYRRTLFFASVRPIIVASEVGMWIDSVILP